MIKKIIIFFHRKKIVYSKPFAPAQFYKAIEVKGEKYLRVVQTNVHNSNNTNPMFDIPVHQVIGIRYLYSPFQLWCMHIVGFKPKNEIVLYKLKD